MKRMLRMELKKAFQNKMFLAALLLGCLITFISFIQVIGRYQTEQQWLKEIAEASSYMQNPMSAVYTLFNHWVGGENQSLGTSIYFLIFPLLAAIPYGWSCCEEKKSGYMRTVIVQGGKSRYFFSRYFAIFLSGGVVMIVPLLLNLALTALVFPAVKPDVIYDVYYGVFGGSLMSELYYSKPFLYVIFYLCIDFVFAGLIAGLSFVVSSWIRIKAVCVIFPEFILLVFHYISNMILHANPYIAYKETSPLFFLRPVQSAYNASWKNIILEAVVLAAAAVFCFLWEKKHEVY